MKLEMIRVQILGLKSDLMLVLHALQRQGYLHIDPITEIPDLSVPPLTLKPEVLRVKEEITFLVAQLEGLLNTLGSSIFQAESLGNYGSYLDEIHEGIAVLSPQVQALTEHHEELKAENDSLPRFAATLQKLLPILPDSALVPGNVSIGLMVSRSHPQVLEMISSRILTMTGGEAEIAGADVDEITRAMLVVTPERFANDIEALLGKEDISRLRLPPEFVASSPDIALASIQRRLSAIPEEILAIQDELRKLDADWREKLTLWRNTLQDALDTYNVLSCVGETEQTFMIVGWVPAKYFKMLQKALASDLNTSAFLTELPITQAAKKTTPVALENPSPVKPFEGLVKLLSTPLYDGIDPSGLMAFFMPLFFGMMLGDIGYGILLLIITLLLLTRVKAGFLRDIIKVVLMGSVWAILFGLLFGECFGTLGEHLGIHPLWFSRENSEYLILLLGLSIGVGAVHISLGLMLGVWEAVREKSKNHLLERGGMLLGLACLLLIIGVLAKLLPNLLMIPAVIGLVIGIVLLGAPLGLPGLLIGPIEFISLIGNILSYMRIAAIGLASVYLAKVANDVAGAFGSLVVGLIIAVVIHSLNLVMGAFSPTIHSLRLHLVEFFQKFYEGGGSPYQPFRSRFISRV
jgi:V/A-type H+-transporting ATPase subunit I